MKVWLSIIVVISLVAFLLLAVFLMKTPEPLVGSSCGTVPPDSRDECCYIKFKEDKFPICNNLKIFFNIGIQRCEYTCDNKPLFCTEEAKQCPDGSFTSKTPILECNFIPCGYN